MDKEKYKEVANALANFVIRVAKGEVTSEVEVAVLPEVAKALQGYFSIIDFVEPDLS